MQHEVLVACLGHPGDVIKDYQLQQDGDDSTRRFAVSGNIQFLSKAEVESINRLVSLGLLYQWLTKFADGGVLLPASSGTSGGHTSWHEGLHFRALRLAMQEVLDEYGQQVAAVELEMMHDHTMPLAYIHHRLQPYREVFPPLVDLCETAADRRMRGAQVLELLFARSQHGSPAVRARLERALFHCNQVLLNQCMGWMLHGVLMDPHREFFVQHTRRSGDGDAVKAGGAKSAWERLSSSRDALADASGTSYREGDKGEDAEREWNTEYTLHPRMIPHSYFPASLAQKVLFVGKAVQVLQREEPTRGQQQFRPGAVQRAPVAGGSAQGGHRQRSSESCFTQEELQRFTRLWEGLKRLPTFHLLAAEGVVDCVQAAVARRLWQLVVVHAQLPAHLDAIKAYMLLGKGDLMEAFLRGARPIMAKDTPARTTGNLNAGPFLAAAQACGCEDSDLFSRFSIVLDSPNFNKPSFTDTQNFRLARSARHAVDTAAVQLCSPTLAPTAPAAWGPFNPWGGADLGGAVGGAGAIWYGTRREVHRDFRTTVVFQYEHEDPPRREEGGDAAPGGICVVLHNHRSCTVGQGGAGLGSEGIPNSLAVRLQLVGKSQEAGEDMWLCIRSYDTGVPEPACRTYGQAFFPKDRLSPGQPHYLTVEYRQHDCVQEEDGEGTMVETEGSCLRVYLNDQDRRWPPALKVSLGIQEAFQLEGGGAYLGVTAAGAITASLLEWSFEGGDKAGTAAPPDQGWVPDDPGVWSQLRMHYRVKWPLHLVLTGEVMQRYGRIFQSLLAVKRAACEIEAIWPALMQHRRTPPREMAWLAPLVALRNNMAFFVNNLQYYLQVDVIEVEYAAMRAELAKAKDFNAVQRAHNEFLVNLLTRCYLDPEQRALDEAVQRALRWVVALCARYHRERDLKAFTASSLQEITQEFSKATTDLFVMLEQAGAKELSMRLDFNGHYSRAAASWLNTG